MSSKFFRPSIVKPASARELYWVEAPHNIQMQTTHVDPTCGWVVEALLWTVPRSWLVLTEAEYEGRRARPQPSRLFSLLRKAAAMQEQYNDLLVERTVLRHQADRLWDELLNALARENAWVGDALSFRASHEYTAPGQRGQSRLYQSILQHFKADPRLADVQERSRHLLGQAEALDAELAVVEVGLQAVHMLAEREQ